MRTAPTFMLDRDYSKFTTKERISLLRELWQRVRAILEVFFGGYLGIPDEKLNILYIKTCLIVEKILTSEETGSIHDLQQRYSRPFESLYEHWGEGDIWWDDGGMQQLTLDFQSAIDEAFVSLGELRIADLITTEFLSEIDEYLTLYSKSKQSRERQWLEKVEKQADKFKQDSQDKTTFYQGAKRKLGFIKD